LQPIGKIGTFGKRNDHPILLFPPAPFAQPTITHQAVPALEIMCALALAAGAIVLLPAVKSVTVYSVMIRTNRSRVYKQLNPNVWPGTGLSPANWLLSIIIVLGSLSAILETEVTLVHNYGQLFRVVELACGVVFSIEYLARLWSVVEQQPDVSHARQRFRFFITPIALFDLIVIAATFVPLLGINVLALRIFRLIRILRIAKLGRFSSAMQHLSFAIHSRRYELLLTVGLAICLLIAGATALYLIEGESQPDKFGSIPRALWWAVITLTTIGYGDVYPMTALGKVVAALVAVVGVGLVAMPTGILAAAFSDAMQNDRRKTLIAGSDDAEPSPTQRQ
jgi:voltage-gated potassium channel